MSFRPAEIRMGCESEWEAVKTFLRTKLFYEKVDKVFFCGFTKIF